VTRTLHAGTTTTSAPRRAEAEVRAAIAFLTRVRVAPTIPDLTGAAAFGLVGALVGAVGAAAIVLVGGAAPLAAGALAIGALALVTGALHLDGLGDTFDALAAPTPDAAEDARRDPRLGSAGVVAIGTALIVDAALVGELISTAGIVATALTCVTAAGASRAIAVLTAFVHRGVARPGGGAWFASRVTPASAALATATAAAVALGSALAVGSPAILVGVAGGAFLGLVGSAALIRARGGLDGDGLGASVEIAFTAVLLVTMLVA
jgi:adenosylcobinamide-GDP ribazoletransferase